MKHFLHSATILTALIVILMCLPSQAADSEKMLAQGQVIVLNSTDEGCCVLRGDLDGDGALTPLDVAHPVNCLGRMYPPLCYLECPDEGDVNCSGNFDPLDAVYLVNYMFRGGPAPCDCSELP